MTGPADPLSLAEVVEEGRRAFAARGHEAPFVTDEWQMFILINGPRLLAVAEAADRLEDYVYHAPICTWVINTERECDCGMYEALAAYHAAARGEK